ncbi:MAG: helix-turn-helix transcriptional regulator [Spirulina sp. SIO3F2]|nr:helix-turn-helix transcriptional regulator [Spirulina sp. SIO3F2]
MSNSTPCLDTPCPIQFVLDILGSKWSILILRELFLGDRRTHELLSALPGISTKTLTIRLRELEQHQLVVRHVYAEVPPRVVYGLTTKGRELQPVMAAMHQVGQQWLAQADCACPLVENDSP